MAQPLHLRSPIRPAAAAVTSSPALARVRESDPLFESAAFEVHPDPLYVVNAAREVVASNRAGRALISTPEDQRALAQHLVWDARQFLLGMRDAIRGAIDARTASAELEVTLPGPLELSVRVVPMAPDFTHALLCVRRREPTQPRPSLARFGFTRMESRVVDLLCSGLTAAKIAAELELSIETVRCHLKQAFVKAGVHRQAELVARVLGA